MLEEIMERGTFDLVDALLSEVAGKDARKATLALMKAAEKVDLMDQAVHIIKITFSLREQALKDWYIEKTKREAIING
jgi:hypothetical protein